MSSLFVWRVLCVIFDGAQVVDMIDSRGARMIAFGVTIAAGPPCFGAAHAIGVIVVATRHHARLTDRIHDVLAVMIVDHLAAILVATSVRVLAADVMACSSLLF